MAGSCPVCINLWEEMEAGGEACNITCKITLCSLDFFSGILGAEANVLMPVLRVLFLCPLLIGFLISALARLAENIGKASVLLGGSIDRWREILRLRSV